MDTQHDAEAAHEVYGIYGNVMHLVQTWELALAILWWRGTTPASGTGEAESKASAEAVDRLENAFIKVTASQARRDLGDDLPIEIAELVGELLPIRNRLAHRFLREQQLGTGFEPGTLAWLGSAGARFDESVRTIFKRMGSLGSYEGPVRAHWPNLGDKLVDRLLAGEPVDFDAELREARESP